MTYSEICDAVAKIATKYDEPDPFRLCRAMDIKLIFQSMGNDSDSVKGFFLESKRIRTITVNNDLPEVIQRIIVAHEICHAEFHEKVGSTLSMNWSCLTKLPLWKKMQIFLLRNTFCKMNKYLRY